MESFSTNKQLNSMSSDEFALQMQKSISYVHNMQRLLDHKVRSEFESLIYKHIQIETKLNE